MFGCYIEKVISDANRVFLYLLAQHHKSCAETAPYVLNFSLSYTVVVLKPAVQSS